VLDSEARDSEVLDSEALLKPGDELIAELLLVSAELETTTFDEIELEDAVLESATLDGIKLDAAALEGATLDGSKLEAAELEGAGITASLDFAEDTPIAELTGTWIMELWLELEPSSVGTPASIKLSRK
jgi:hypothetical protein